MCGLPMLAGGSLPHRLRGPVAVDAKCVAVAATGGPIEGTTTPLWARYVLWTTKPTPVADVAPVEPFLTGYDMNHPVTYLRLLDADADGADWREVARIVLNLDVQKDPDRIDASSRWRLLQLQRVPEGVAFHSAPATTSTRTLEPVPISMAYRA